MPTIGKSGKENIDGVKMDNTWIELDNLDLYVIGIIQKRLNKLRKGFNSRIIKYSFLRRIYALYGIIEFRVLLWNIRRRYRRFSLLGKYRLSIMLETLYRMLENEIKTYIRK